MENEMIGEIVISPRVLEVITGVATTKVEGVHSLHNKTVTDSLSKVAHGRGVYLKTEQSVQISMSTYNMGSMYLLFPWKFNGQSKQPFMIWLK